MDTDPSRDVDAPVRGALAGVMGRGLALVGALALLAAWPLAARLPVPATDAFAWAGIGLLFGYVAWVRVAQWRRGAAAERDRRLAWDRARRVDPSDAALGLLVAAWVPAGLLLALGLLLWPHFTHPDWRVAQAWIVMAVPPTLLAWVLATTTWLDACRDDLARAEGEAERRLRRYWADVGR
jgi:hypothetical protein